MTQPLHHVDPHRTDERLAAEAAAFLGAHPSLQLVAELLTRLREMAFPWWTPEQLRAAYPVVERMKWLAARPDVRQRITTSLTGLASRAARNKTPEFQAALIDSVVDEGDITLDALEHAFEPADVAVYGPAGDLWRLFRRRMPWDDDSTQHQDLVGWLVGALLSDKSSLDGAPRTPVLSAIAVRTAIDGRVWHSRIPLHVRVAIDDARFAAQRDRPFEPYGVERDLQIASPALIAASIPLRDLVGVIEVASNALGFANASHEDPSAEPHEPGDRSPGSRAFGRESAPRAQPRSEVDDEVPKVSIGERPATRPLGESSDDWSIADSAVGGAGVADRPHDELEHTNPWAVPTLPAELGDVVAALRGDKNRSE
ncbi:MAG: hypothetical protein U0271_01980 [Polyangiaceae bacterium]